MKVYIKYFSDEISKIEKMEKGDWIDLRSAVNLSLKAGEFAYVSLGIGMILAGGQISHGIPDLLT